MFANCQSRGSDTQAGRPVRRWRYRFPDAKGPGRTVAGEMWIDAETGLVLRYVGTARVGGTPREWRVTSIVYGPVPNAMLEPDASLVKTEARNAGSTRK